MLEKLPIPKLNELLSKYSDLLLAVLIVVPLAMIIVPMPTWLIDVLLTVSITFAIVILLVSFYISEALKIASFPTILLMCTLFRLALNISSTRLVLAHGYAGEVINAFGSFVVGGNYVVGGVLFLIITIVNFIVIARAPSVFRRLPPALRWMPCPASRCLLMPICALEL